ncbi:BHLH domain-containing protein [Psidium guajava]|nr:BHLH domain-containing protein [Psidium guajava]
MGQGLCSTLLRPSATVRQSEASTQGIQRLRSSELRRSFVVLSPEASPTRLKPSRRASASAVAADSARIDTEKPSIMIPSLSLRMPAIKASESLPDHDASTLSFRQPCFGGG